jgi:hypothetical protein
LACVALFIALPPVTRAQGESYDALVREAVGEYNMGNWREARLLFGQAHELHPSARTWRGMGLTDYESKRYVEAIGELQAALESTVKRLTDAQREEVQGVLERSQRFVAIYTLTLPSDASELRLDGKPASVDDNGALRLNPGAHVLSVRRASGAVLERRFDVEVGARGTLELESDEPAVIETGDAQSEHEDTTRLAPDRAAEGGRVWTWVAGGATLALGAASIAFGVLALDANDTFKERALAGQPLGDAKSDGQSYQLLANVGLGLTAAAAITTVVLFVVEGGSDEDERAQAQGVQLQLGLGTIALRGSL